MAWGIPPFLTIIVYLIVMIDAQPGAISTSRQSAEPISSRGRTGEDDGDEVPVEHVGRGVEERIGGGAEVADPAA